MQTPARLIARLVAVACVSLSAPAFAFDLANCGTTLVPVPCPYVTYGDGNSYALTVNTLLYSYASQADPTVPNQGTGPGNPFYVVSTPGAIKDLTVIGTGASGGPVNTNYPGADNAYPTPNSDGIVYFSTGTVADPGGAGEFTGDAGGTWDVSLVALKAFMDGENSLNFFFNNNQTNSGASTNQNLAAWAQVTVRNPAGGIVATYDFTNQNDKFATFVDGGGGTLNGNPGAYAHAGPLDSPIVGDNDNTDYVMSGGELCYVGDSLATFSPVPCSTPGAKSLDSNLGANQAAYVVVFPELDDLLAGAAGLFNLSDALLAGYSLNVNLRFGCDPAIADAADCAGRSLNNGYEQVFISTASRVINMPLPSTSLLLGIGLLGAGIWARRRVAHHR